MENDKLTHLLQEALLQVMEEDAPEYACDDPCNAAKMQQLFALSTQKTSFAKLCMCALVDNCLGGNVAGIKQVLALAKTDNPAAAEGALGQMMQDLRQQLGDDD